MMISTTDLAIWIIYEEEAANAFDPVEEGEAFGAGILYALDRLRKQFL